MENASKALIIAGAILISILLISAGIMVLNSTQGVIDEGKNSSKIIEIEEYNSRFTRYCGNKVLGANVIELQNFINSYNAANDPDVTLENSVGTLNPRKYYNVSVPSDGYNNGYIMKIKIEN